MPSDLKIKREINKDYKKFIEQQPCVVRGFNCMGDVVAHHDPSVGAGGSDFMAIPLCVVHHIPGVHQKGKDTFQEHHCIDFNKERVRLLLKYISTLEVEFVEDKIQALINCIKEIKK